MTKKLVIGGLVASLLIAGGLAGAVTAHSKVNPADVALTEAQAIEIALAQIPGGEVQETELDSKDGVAVYEVEVVNAEGQETEVELDANSGEVLEVEAKEDKDCRGKKKGKKKGKSERPTDA